MDNLEHKYLLSQMDKMIESQEKRASEKESSMVKWITGVAVAMTGIIIASIKYL